MNIVEHFQAGSAIEGQGRRITAVCMLLLAPQPLQKPQVRTTLMPRPDMVCKEKRSLAVTDAIGCVLDEGMESQIPYHHHLKSHSVMRTTLCCSPYMHCEYSLRHSARKGQVMQSRHHN